MQLIADVLLDLIKYGKYDGNELLVSSLSPNDATMCTNYTDIALVSLYSFVTVLPRITILMNMMRNLVAGKSASWVTCCSTIVLILTNAMVSMILMIIWCRSIGLLQNRSVEVGRHVNKQVFYSTTTTVAILTNISVIILKIVCIKPCQTVAITNFSCFFPRED